MHDIRDVLERAPKLGLRSAVKAIINFVAFAGTTGAVHFKTSILAARYEAMLFEETACSEVAR